MTDNSPRAITLCEPRLLDKGEQQLGLCRTPKNQQRTNFVIMQALSRLRSSICPALIYLELPGSRRCSRVWKPSFANNVVLWHVEILAILWYVGF